MRLFDGLNPAPSASRGTIVMTSLVILLAGSHGGTASGALKIHAATKPQPSGGVAS
jgi:hypothetical protein